MRDAHLLVLAHADQLAHCRAQHPPVAGVAEQLLDGMHLGWIRVVLGRLRLD